MQSISSGETYANGTSKDLVCKKEECNNVINQYKNIQLGLYFKRIHKGTQSKLATNS